MTTTAERLETLLQEFARLLRDALARRVRGRTDIDIDELEQEARIRLWKALEREKTIEHPPSYIYRVAATVFIDALRRVKARGEDISLEETEERFTRVSEREDPARRVESGELLRQIIEGLDTMPADSADAVRLHLQGLNTIEIAALLGWTEPRARNLVYRGMERLREELQKKGVRP